MSLSRIVEFKRNKGGSTITIKAYFADGSRAAFKPDQLRSVSNYRAEIAAFHLDRLLGFGRTAPVVGRKVDRAVLRRHLVHTGADSAWLERFDKEVKDSAGQISGALIAWHSKRLSSEPPDRNWTHHLSSDKEKVPPPALQTKLLEWSDLVVFDFLIDNYDRWSGGNVLRLGVGGQLIFLDNGAGFTGWRAAREVTTMKRVRPICRFNPHMLRALEAVGPEVKSSQRLGARLSRSLARDPLSPVLDKAHFAALDSRVKSLLAHVQRCRDQLGSQVELTVP